MVALHFNAQHHFWKCVQNAQGVELTFLKIRANDYKKFKKKTSYCFQNSFLCPVGGLCLYESLWAMANSGVSKVSSPDRCSGAVLVQMPALTYG